MQGKLNVVVVDVVAVVVVVIIQADHNFNNLTSSYPQLFHIRHRDGPLQNIV